MANRLSGAAPSIAEVEGGCTAINGTPMQNEHVVILLALNGSRVTYCFFSASARRPFNRVPALSSGTDLALTPVFTASTPAAERTDPCTVPDRRGA
jgi:hypothetical protein